MFLEQLIFENAFCFLKIFKFYNIGIFFNKVEFKNIGKPLTRDLQNTAIYQQFNLNTKNSFFYIIHFLKV